MAANALSLEGRAPARPSGLKREAVRTGRSPSLQKKFPSWPVHPAPDNVRVEKKGAHTLAYVKVSVYDPIASGE